jgi:hypothetical protein
VAEKREAKAAAVTFREAALAHASAIQPDKSI